MRRWGYAHGTCVERGTNCAAAAQAKEEQLTSRNDLLMALRVRRVVTGHDQIGRAVVLMDEECRNVVTRRLKHSSCVVWSTGSFPSDNSGWEDGAARQLNSTDPNGTVFRIVRYEPGVAARNHRTNSIDYA